MTAGSELLPPAWAKEQRDHFVRCGQESIMRGHDYFEQLFYQAREQGQGDDSAREESSESASPIEDEAPLSAASPEQKDNE